MSLLSARRRYFSYARSKLAYAPSADSLDRLARHFDVAPAAETTVPQSLTLGNVMIGLAMNRRYAFHSVGALGVIELTAPGGAAFVTQGLRRLGVPAKASHYFALHAVLDVKHSEAWNREVLDFRWMARPQHQVS